MRSGVPPRGGWQEVVYVFLCGHSLWRGKHIKNPLKVMGQSHAYFVYVFLFVFCLKLCFVPIRCSDLGLHDVVFPIICGSSGLLLGIC